MSTPRGLSRENRGTVNPVKISRTPRFVQRDIGAAKTTGKSDPKAIIPIADFVKYVENVEKSYPRETAEQVTTRIRQLYYGGSMYINGIPLSPGKSAFDRLIPDAPSHDSSVTVGHMTTTHSATPRVVEKHRVDKETYSHLTAKADENSKGDNPSPYLKLASGKEVDVGHLLLGLDALLHPRTQRPFTTYDVPNIGPSSFVADIGIAAVWMSYHQEEKEVHPDAKDAGGAPAKPDLSVYYRMSAPEQDLLGDVDSFGVHEQWKATDHPTLSGVMSAYYLGKRGAQPGQAKRFQTFAIASGLYQKSKNDIKLRPTARAGLISRVNKFNDLYAAGRWGAVKAIVAGSRAKKRQWPHTPAVVDRFLAWLAKNIASE